MATNGFFPDDFAVATATSGYLKMEPGTCTFVIMGAKELDDGNVLTGYLGWMEDDDGKHPIRATAKKDIPSDARDIKQFMAIKVWNKGLYEESDGKEIVFQILEITQKTIMNSIVGLVADSDWGDPVGKYPISIERDGEGLKTVYTVTPKPVKPMPKPVKDAFETWECDLTKLLTGDDPFETEEMPF